MAAEGCTPTSCGAQGKNCGTVDKGCGLGTENCGTCGCSQFCNAGTCDDKACLAPGAACSCTEECCNAATCTDTNKGAKTCGLPSGSVCNSPSKCASGVCCGYPDACTPTGNVSDVLGN
ncbi:MAG: hypothetical protein U0263_06385 [Polyangiaceae bacterium]